MKIYMFTREVHDYGAIASYSKIIIVNEIFIPY